MIMIKVNSKEKELAGEMPLSEYIKGENLVSTNIALAVNGKLVPRQEWENHILHDGDNMIIIQASYGG